MSGRMLMIGVFAVFLIFGILTGCSDEGSDGEAQGESSEVNLKMAVFPADEPTFKKAYEEFHKENPNINIEFESFPQKQYYEKIRIQLSSGVGYDLFAGQIDTMVDTGILEPLDEHIKESDMDVSGFGNMYDAMKMDGEVLGLPYRKSNWMMYYNKDLFDEKGVDYPSDDMTWAEFRDLAKEMTSGEAGEKTYGAYLQQWPQTWYMPAVQDGASIIDKDLTPFKAALENRIQLEKDGSIMSWSEQITTGAHYNAAFQKGNIAMNIIGDWHVAQLRQAEAEGDISFDWDVVPIPHPENVQKNTTLALPVGLMMNKNTEHKEAAYKALQFFTGEQGAKTFAEEGYITGYVDEEVKEAYLNNDSQKPENLQYFLETKEYPEYPMLPGVKNIVVGQIYKQEGELALLGEQTVDETISKIEKRVQEEWASKYQE